jgi:hypothetical protein
MRGFSSISREWRRNYLPRDIVRIAGDLRSGRLLPTEMMAGRLGR